jgi:TolB-like protein/AraC-like DNA-binding protein/Flp pilus assembly protein TadD
MEDSFIDKIKQIVLDHLDDEKFGVKELSSKIGLSKSQAYRKVKSLTNKSINQLIKETRLEEAAKLILESDLHASEISYKVGFSSPSYFNKCFSKYYGITPGEYKEKCKDNLPINGFDQKTSTSGVKKFQAIIYILGAAILLFAIIPVIKSKSSTTNSNSAKISIAVLYFDDHSQESNMQWYSNSITEAITSKISNIKTLMVTSRTSLKQYRNSDQSIPEITKALGVDYVIEGSSLKFNDSIFITVQLIDKYDEHKWSKSFSDSYGNSFKLLNKVSKYIANKFEIDLSTEEEKRIDYIPTNSPEALQFFSQGLSYLDLVSVENLDTYRFILKGGYKNLKISDSLFRQALTLDPNYAEAMAELAFVLQLRGEKGSKKWADVKFKEIDSLLDLSLEINPNSSVAYITKGIRQGYNHGDWEKAGNYFKRALVIKPNNANNHLYSALYFALRSAPDYKKALYHINIAQKLNPHSATINYDKILYLLKNNNITEAEAFYKNNNSFFTDILKAKIHTKLLKANAKKVSLEKKDWTEAIKFYHQEIEKDPNNAEIYRLLAEAYDEVLNDAPNFLKYAKKAFYLDTVQYFYKRSYGFAMLRNKKFKEILDFLERYRNGAKAPLYGVYYFKHDYKKAQIYLDMFYHAPSYSQANLFAQRGEINKAYEILNKDVLANYEKAKVFAILKERDSMYYYINKEQDIYNIREFNSYFEVDPYRKEERFKALLRKHYLPLTYWNE